MPSVRVDLVDGGDFEKRISPTGREEYAATRMAFVYGVTDGSDRQSATALIRAQAAVEALFPRWSLYDPLVPLCFLQGWRNEGIAENSDAVKVRLVYGSMPEGGGGGGGGGELAQPWVITDDRVIEAVDTQIGPIEGKPLAVGWISEAKIEGEGANQQALPRQIIGPDVVTLRTTRIVRRVVITGIIRRTPLEKLITLTNTVNKEAFDSKPIGWWRCSGVHTETSLGAKFWKVSATFDMRVDQDWMEFGLLRHRGKWYGDPKSVKALRAKPYMYGEEGGNGVVRCGFYPLGDFRGVLGIAVWADLYPKD